MGFGGARDLIEAGKSAWGPRTTRDRSRPLSLIERLKIVQSEAIEAHNTKEGWSKGAKNEFFWATSLNFSRNVFTMRLDYGNILGIMLTWSGPG